MKRIATEQDGSRPVTVAPPPLGFDLGHGGLVVSDVMGYNYADPQIEAFHKANPKLAVMGTENVSAVSTRGIYKIDAEKGFVSSYDPYTTSGRASAEGWWRFVNSRSWMPGGFVWTGFDYRGEPSPYQWPNIGSQYGVIDTCGFPKDTYFYYQAWWTAKPVLHIFPHWNWPGLEGKEIAVWVHTNMDRVDLLQDGKSLGAKDVPKDSHVAWNVTYQPGALEARGFKNGRQVMVARRETVGNAAKLAIRTDRAEVFANGEDLVFCSIEVQDAHGRVLPITDQEVTFAVTGPARLIGVGNGDPTSHDSDIGLNRHAFSGLCMGIVQASKISGDFRIEVTSPGLSPASTAVAAKSITLQPQVAVWEREVPKGPGVTGLWRPTSATGSLGPDPMQLAVAGDTLYTFVQNGGALTGKLEAPGSGFGPGGGAVGGPIEGAVDGKNISFHIGAVTYTGTINGEQIELRKTTPPFPGLPSTPPAETGPKPAIGPPPDGSDPSLAGFRNRGAQAPILLRRANR
jgi:beta-galactosidase